MPRKTNKGKTIAKPNTFITRAKSHIVKKTRGRNDSFHPYYIEFVNRICASTGADNVALTKIFGVTEPTLYNWMRKYPAFKEAIQEGKDFYNIYVAEKRLQKRVEGYSYYEEHVYETLDKDGVKHKLKKRIKKQIPPDTTAIIFFLTNRMGHRWQHVRNIEKNVTVNKTNVVKLEGFSLEQKRKMLTEARKQINNQVVDAKFEESKQKPKRKKKKSLNK